MLGLLARLAKRQDIPCDKSVQACAISRVENSIAGLVFAVLGDKCLEPVLAAADGDDFGAFEHEAVREGGADAGRGADEQHAFILKNHVESSKMW